MAKLADLLAQLEEVRNEKTALDEMIPKLEEAAESKSKEYDELVKSHQLSCEFVEYLEQSFEQLKSKKDIQEKECKEELQKSVKSYEDMQKELNEKKESLAAEIRELKVRIESSMGRESASERREKQKAELLAEVESQRNVLVKKREEFASMGGEV